MIPHFVGSVSVGPDELGKMQQEDFSLQFLFVGAGEQFDLKQKGGARKRNVLHPEVVAKTGSGSGVTDSYEQRGHGT